MAEALHVDCYGKGHTGEIVVPAGERAVHFVFDEQRKRGRPFALALFLDDAALGQQYMRYPHDRRVALLIESPLRPVFGMGALLARRFPLVLTHYRPLLERGAPFAPFYFGTSWLGGVDVEASFPKSRLVSFIGSVLHGDAPGYRFRKAVASALAGDARVERFGYGIREIAAKVEALGEYAFSVALENTREDYYFSEKLLDCFLTETVPVYWGCESIGTIFDERGLIEFGSLDDLQREIGELSFARHRQMLPYVRANRRLAIEQRWHSMAALYERLAAELVRALPSSAAVRVRPRVVGVLQRLGRAVRLTGPG